MVYSSSGRNLPGPVSPHIGQDRGAIGAAPVLGFGQDDSLGQMRAVAVPIRRSGQALAFRVLVWRGGGKSAFGLAGNTLTLVNLVQIVPECSPPHTLQVIVGFLVMP